MQCCRKRMADQHYEYQDSMTLTETGFDCASDSVDPISSCNEQPLNSPLLQSAAAEPDNIPADSTVVQPIICHIVTPTVDCPVTNQHAAHIAGCMFEEATDHASTQGKEDTCCHKTVARLTPDTSLSSSDSHVMLDTEYGTAGKSSHHISIDTVCLQEVAADLTAVSHDSDQTSQFEADLTATLLNCDQINQHDADTYLTETPLDSNYVQHNSDLTESFHDIDKISQSTDSGVVDNDNARIFLSDSLFNDKTNQSTESGVTDDNVHFYQSNSHSEGSNGSGSQASDTASTALLAGVRVKQEPADTGYGDGGQDMRRPWAGSATGENIVSSTVVRRGKRKVRVTVVRGEWRTARTPHPDVGRRKSGNAANVNILTVPSLKTWDNACAKSKASDRTKRKHSSEIHGGMVAFSGLADSNQHCEISTPQVSNSDTGIRAEPRSSFPVAVYRNAYIKAEPADDAFTSPPTNESSCASVQEEMFSSGCGRSLVVTPFHVPKARGRGRGRGRRIHSGDNLISSAPGHFEQFSPGSSTRRPAQMEAMVQPCSVQLTRLSPDISVAGTVNIRTDPQVSRRLGWWKNPTLQPGARPHITVANPEAYHPVQRRNKSGPRPWSCQTCDKSFKTASALSQHKKIHSGVKEHVCHICQKAFTYKSALTAHSRTHSQERPFVCKLCGAGFRLANHLRNHLATHSKVKPFSCDHCSKRFAQKVNLQTHLKRHAGVKPYSCPKCDATFLFKSYLAVHLRRHTGEKPYCCDQCTATFAHTTSLQAHLRSHNDERPFKCHLCSSAFRQQSHRRTHIRLIHTKPQKEGRQPKRRHATNTNQKTY